MSLLSVQRPSAAGGSRHHSPPARSGPRRYGDVVTGTCDSCGRDDESLEVVHRVYVTPEAWDSPGKVEVVDKTEKWCFVCRTHYPHQLPDGD